MLKELLILISLIIIVGGVIVSVIYIKFKFKFITKSALLSLILTLYMASSGFILGKMGLISIYMKQFESFLSSSGHKGLIWESKAIEKIIFPIGNAFTFPSIIMIFLIIAQTIYAYWFTLSLYLVNKKLKFIILLILSFFIIFVFLKSLTIDFYTEIPNIF